MQQKQSRRRQPMEYFSPANSTNQKQKPIHHRHPSFSLTAHSQEDDIDYSVGNQSSHLLLMATYIGAAERHLGSSFGSCATRSTVFPTTPSPVLSSAPPGARCSDDEDDPSFVTPIQSYCVISNGKGRESSSPEETEQESRKLAITREGDGPRHFLCKEEEEDYFGTSSCFIDDDDGDDGRLPAVIEEQEAEEKRRCNHNRHPTLSSLYLDAESDEENSDHMESFIEERTASAMKARRTLGLNFAAEKRRVDTLARTLTAWREARTIKLMDKLRKKEAVINKWEKKMTTKAKMDMKETEMKLEKKRERELIKMQQRIRAAKKTAEKKKARERAATGKKIDKVTEAFEKTLATGKLPWFFLCL